jgi:hypothetical protein
MGFAGNNRLGAAVLGAAFLAAVAGCPATALAADGIKAAYVETVIPSRSYTVKLNVTGLNPNSTMGPSTTGVLGISSLVVTNYTFYPKLVEIGSPAFYGGATCGSLNSFAANYPSFDIYVQPQSTLVIPFPTPYVINPSGGQACIFASAGFLSFGDSIDVVVNGELN